MRSLQSWFRKDDARRNDGADVDLIEDARGGRHESCSPTDVSVHTGIDGVGGLTVGSRATNAAEDQAAEVEADSSQCPAAQRPHVNFRDEPVVVEEPAPEEPPQQSRWRAGLERGRRLLFLDWRYKGAGISGLHSKEFEVDLLCGERIKGEPIRVRLTRTESFWRRFIFTIVTLGFYVLWTRCCAAGSQVFDVDARLAITSHGRLLLWTHSATGGGLPFIQHCCRALQKPTGYGSVLILMIFATVGPLLLGINLIEVCIVVGLFAAVAFTSLVFKWMFEHSTVMASTSIRQFDACDLSCVRLLCYSYRSLWGLRGEITCCQVNMFFGPYPKPQIMRRTMPWSAYDSGSVMASPIIGQSQGSVSERVTEAVGQGALNTENSFTSIIASILILLAFSAFMNEMTDFFSGLVKCIDSNPGASPQLIARCASIRFRQWWLGVSTSGLQTVISHWIDLCDWSLQLVLFFYVVGPALGMIWKIESDQSAATLSFVVDRRDGSNVEDQDFEEHWLEVVDFLTELFERGSSLPPEAVGRLPPEGYVGGVDLNEWSELIEGDELHTGSENGSENASTRHAPDVGAQSTDQGVTVGVGRSSSSKARFSDRPRGTWAQVEEMTNQLIEPFTSKVRVYKGVLSWLKDERLLAVYPERPRMTLIVKVKACITCGLDYFLHYRRQRREAALILTDRRLIQISALTAQARRSLKVDMFAIGGFVKYLSFNPPRQQCCIRPPGRIALASRCGTLEMVLHRMRTSQTETQARQLWQGLTLLQDAPPLSSQEFDSFATVESSGDGGGLYDDDHLDALQDAVAMWGRPSNLGTRPSVGARSSGDRPSMPRLSLIRVSRASAGTRSSANGNQSHGNSLTANVGGEADVLSFGVKNEPWGLVLDEGEVALWGPALFEDEVWRPCCCPLRRQGLRMPTTLVTITTRRLAVVQFDGWGPFACGGICRRSYITSVSVVPLRWVLGFCIAEDFSLQRAMFTRLLGHLCCWPNNESRLTIKILTNAGLGKVYLNSLFVTQRLLPRGTEPQSAFEGDKVLELRRWLGNVALFFVDRDDPSRKHIQIELWRCAHGLAPN